MSHLLDRLAYWFFERPHGRIGRVLVAVVLIAVAVEFVAQWVILTRGGR